MTFPPRSYRWLLMLILPLFIGGCDYDNPLAGPGKSINAWLLGVWEVRQKDGTEEKRLQVAVLPQKSDRYTVWFRELDASDKPLKSIRFDGWTTRVGPVTFLVLKNTSEGSPGFGRYSFFQTTLMTPSVLKVRRPVLDEGSSDDSSYQLRQQIRRKAKQGGLFNETETAEWQRISEVFWQPENDQPQPYQRPRDPNAPGGVL